MVSALTFAPMTSVAPQWHRAFSRFGEDVSDWTPALRAIAEDFRKGEVKQFLTEGGYGSGGWKALSPKYRAWKEEHAPGRPTLVFSGLLRKAACNPRIVITKDSLTITIDDSGSYQVFSKRLGRVVTRHKPATAGFHQTGGGRLPKRPVIEIPESQRIRWAKIFQDWLVSRRITGGRFS